MRKFITAATVGFVLLTPSIADAKPTTKGAKTAVKRKLRQGGYSDAIKYPYIRCWREARSRFYCEWVGLTRRDIDEGNTGGTSGIADVTYYAGRYIARVY